MFHPKDPLQHTQQPMVTGTSVIALKYDGGVLVAADTLASYGKLSKYRDTRRLFEMKSTIIGAGGDISDFTAIKETLSNLATAEYDHNDGHYLSPRNIWLFLGNLFYSRRNKFNPLWNSCVVAGFDKGKSFLGFADLLGTSYESNAIATGYGSYIAIPLLRKFLDDNPNPTKQEAVKVVEDCLRVLFYRDAASFNRIQIGCVDATGTSVTEPYKLETDWAFAETIRGYGAVYSSY